MESLNFIVDMVEERLVRGGFKWLANFKEIRRDHRVGESPSTRAEAWRRGVSSSPGPSQRWSRLNIGYTSSSIHPRGSLLSFSGGW
jgi:hypothetical protein